MSHGGDCEERGNFEQALEVYVLEQNWANAARVAFGLDRNLEAGNYCLLAGRPYDAAVCFEAVGALKECLDALVHVPATSPSYRSACLLADRVSQRLDVPLGKGPPRLPLSTDEPGAPASTSAVSSARLGTEGTVQWQRSGDTIALQVPPTVGSIFAGRYRIEGLLGHGGSATVFRAVDLELDEPVALKLFRPTSADQAEHLVARFRLELSLSRKLAHPNIIRLFDLGIHQTWRYLTMEVLEGSDLASWLAALGKPMPPIEGLRFLEQICLALQVAHDLGIVHRDIKPENLFISRDGHAKLMDFGIAKKLWTPGVTIAGMIMGTPEYMSPEQASGAENLTAATDLYALGATAYAMFTGRPPFTHPQPISLLVAHATELPVAPRVRNPELDAELEAVILKLLQKVPGARFQSAQELGQALGSIRRRLQSRLG